MRLRSTDEANLAGDGQLIVHLAGEQQVLS